MPIDPSAPTAAPLRGKVLCIEDQPVAMALLAAMLAELPGIVPLQAATGREGIRLARSERPDVVLLDMHLPDIGGLEVVRQLDEPIASGRLKVILLTADTFSMDVIKAMSLGAREYWTKPVSFERLVDGLTRALR